jgi:hypothetical protein
VLRNTPVLQSNVPASEPSSLQQNWGLRQIQPTPAKIVFGSNPDTIGEFLQFLLALVAFR